MDELEAVNTLLRNIGTSPVNSLTVGHPDVQAARTVLDQTRKRIQRRGLWFNTDYDVLLQPEATTKKILVQNVVELDINNREIIKRGDYLYNRLYQTYQFDGPVTVRKMVQYVEWDDLPDVAKEYAVYRAGAQFVRDELEDESLVRDLKEEARLAQIEMEAQHLRSQQLNSFQHQRIARARGGVRPYHSGNGRRFHGTPDA